MIQRELTKYWRTWERFGRNTPLPMNPNKNWFKTKDIRPFIDIALFSADFWGHSYWSHDQAASELHYVLHFVDSDFLPEELCKVSPDEALELARLIEKFGHGKENYLAVRNWAAERKS